MVTIYYRILKRYYLTLLCTNVCKCLLNYSANQYVFQIRIIVEKFIQIYITLVGSLGLFVGGLLFIMEATCDKRMIHKYKIRIQIITKCIIIGKISRFNLFLRGLLRFESLVFG